MAKSRDSSHKVFSLVLTVLFGVLALAITYNAVKNGAFELRSKAAQTEQTVQQWEFTGTTTEGWAGQGFSNFTVQPARAGGSNEVVAGVTQLSRTGGPSMTQRTVKLLPTGMKKIRIRARVIPTTGIVGVTIGGSTSTTTTVTGTPFPYSLNVTYASATTPNLTTTKNFSAMANGQFREFTVDLEETLPLQMSSLKLDFQGTKPNATVQVDYIRIRMIGNSTGGVGGALPTPTCTPRPACLDQTPTCMFKLAPGTVFCPKTTPAPVSCSGADGTACTMGSCPTCTADGKCPAIGCKLQMGICKGHICIPNSVTPVPSPGCRYVAVQCARAPCPPTIVCNMPNGGVGACTKDLKICPGGTNVGRTGPNCEFAACPVQTGCPSVCPNGSRSCYKPCASPGGSTACTKDAFTCPDGMKVGRSGPTCEFYCPNTPLGV